MDSCMDNVYVASIYRMTAVSFWECARQLSQHIEVGKDGRPKNITALPFYYLTSHAAELLLKSALLKRGFSEQDLKKFDYRHNLKNLLNELISKGIVVTPETVFLLNGLDEQHKDHSLRYSALMANGKKTFLPPIDIMFNMLDELLMLTRISTQGK